MDKWHLQLGLLTVMNHSQVSLKTFMSLSCIQKQLLCFSLTFKRKVQLSCSKWCCYYLKVFPQNGKGFVKCGAPGRWWGLEEVLLSLKAFPWRGLWNPGWTVCSSTDSPPLPPTVPIRGPEQQLHPILDWNLSNLDLKQTFALRSYLCQVCVIVTESR